MPGQPVGLRGFIGDSEVFDLNSEPDVVRRTPTDTPCCAIFVTLVLLQGIIIGYAFWFGDLSRFSGLPDYSGKVCGESPSVWDKPMLYFCQDEYSKFSRRNRICVSTCEALPSTRFVECPGGTSERYSSVSYAGILCVPTEEGRLRLNDQLFSVFLGDPDVSIFLAIMAFWRAWPAVCFAALAAIVMAFLYLLAINQCTRTMVYVGLFSIVAGCGLSGAYAVFVALTFGADGIPGTGDSRVSVATAILAFVCGFTTLATWSCYRRNVKLSMLCVKAASECIWDMPSLLFEPFLALAWKLSILAFLLVGLLHLASCVHTDVTDFGGERTLRTHVDYQWWEYSLLAFYVIMSVWILEFSSALSNFVVSYAAQVWFFSPYDRCYNTKDTPPFATCHAYRAALRYHLGTLAYGSFIICIFRVPRMVLGSIFYGSHVGDNPVAKCLARCCFCCHSVMDHYLRYVCHYTYMDVAMNSSRFCKAAFHSLVVMEHQAVHLLSLHGASWLVQSVGLWMVTATGALLTYVMCKFCFLLGDMDRQAHVQSEYYVTAPALIAIVAGVVCWFSAMPFLMLCGLVADNLIYCFALERKRHSMRTVNHHADQSMLTRLTSCSGRVDPHKVAHMRHPPMMVSLMEASKYPASSWFD